MEEFKVVVKNITHQVVVDGITYTTPVYDVEYTCYFRNNGEFIRLICNKHKGVNTIPHLNINEMCTGQNFIEVINEAYQDKELIHLVCERFFRQYNELDACGKLRVLIICGFVVSDELMNEYNFKLLLSEYQYYCNIDCGQIMKLTHDCKGELVWKYVYLIKRKQQ